MRNFLDLIMLAFKAEEFLRNAEKYFFNSGFENRQRTSEFHFEFLVAHKRLQPWWFIYV